MDENSTFTATIDRIAEGIAVLLLEDDGEVIEERHIHDLEQIPEAGRHDGAVLTVSITGDEIVAIDYEEEVEAQRRERMQNRFDRLSERPPGRDSET